MSHYEEEHKWSYTGKLAANTDHPTYYYFVCHCGKTKTVCGDDWTPGATQTLIHIGQQVTFR